MTSKEKVLRVHPDAFETSSGIWRGNEGGQAPVYLGMSWEGTAFKLLSAPSPASNKCDRCGAPFVGKNIPCRQCAVPEPVPPEGPSQPLPASIQRHLDRLPSRDAAPEAAATGDRDEYEAEVFVTKGEAAGAKACPKCGSFVPPDCKVCYWNKCGYEFVFVIPFAAPIAPAAEEPTAKEIQTAISDYREDGVSGSIDDSVERVLRRFVQRRKGAKNE